MVASASSSAAASGGNEANRSALVALPPPNLDVIVTPKKAKLRHDEDDVEPLVARAVKAGQPPRTLIPTDGQSPDGGPQEMACCWFDCGGPRPIADCCRPHAKANWVCRPCANAKRAIETAARANQQDKVDVDNLKTKDVPAWKAKVRACRIAPGEPFGVANLDHRTLAIANVMKSFKVKVGVQGEARVHVLTEKRFVQYQKMYEGLSAQEANALWEKQSKDPTLAKKDKSGNVVLAVSAWPTFVGYIAKEMEGSISSSSAINDQADLDKAGEQLAQMANPGFLGGNTFGPMGELIGGTSSAADGQGAVAHMLDEMDNATGAAPSKMIVDDADFQRADAYRQQREAETAKRAIESRDDDPANPVQKMRKLSLKTGVTGQLAEAQRGVVNVAKQIMKVWTCKAITWARRSRRTTRRP